MVNEYNKIEETNKRRDDFFSKLDLAPITIKSYHSALSNKKLKEIIKEVEGKVESIFEITDLPTLWKIYSIVNIHPYNVKNHRSISAAVNRYIIYINNGEKYGKRIDYQKKRGKRSSLT